MTRRIKRHQQYELTLSIKDDAFIKTPRDAQRNWFLNRVIRESAEELQELNVIAPHMVRGSDQLIELDRQHGSLSETDIMEDWQIPVMKAMASAVTKQGGDVLEVGMGRGIASDFIQEHDPKSHTIIECNEQIASTFDEWKSKYPGKDIKIITSLWQECLDQLQMYDGILFHTYPLSDEEFVDTVVKDVTFAAHFLSAACEHLRPGGSLTYLTNEFDSLSRAHQRELFKYFSSFSLSVETNLDVPDNTRDALWIKKMLIIKATK